MTANDKVSVGELLLSDLVLVMAHTAMRLSKVSTNWSALRKYSTPFFREVSGSLSQSLLAGAVAGWMEYERPPKGTNCWEASMWTTTGTDSLGEDAASSISDLEIA